MWKRIAPVLALLTVLTIAAAPAHATGTLSDILGQLAEDIHKAIERRGGHRVRLERIVGQNPVASQSTAEPLLQLQLRKRLEELGIQVVADDGKYDFALSGTFREIEDRSERQLVVIAVDLTDRVGQRFQLETRGRLVPYSKESKTAAKQSGPYVVDNEPDVTTLLQINPYIPAGASPAQRAKILKEVVDHPRAAIDGTRVRARATDPARPAPFALEVLTAAPRPDGGPHTPKDYRLAAPRPENGQAFAAIPRDDVYAVRLVNDADFDVAVELRVDGLSMFHATTVRDANGAPAYRYVVVPKRSAAVVFGWFIDLKATDEFLVTAHAKSDAGKLGRTAGVGTITANFFAAWDKKQGRRPDDEPDNPEQYSHSSDATGHGCRIAINYQPVEYEVGVFRGAVAVRYAK